MGLDTPTLVALAAFAIGIAFGALARWSGFCLRGAVEDVLTRDNAPRARGFLLAMAVALIAVQALVLTGRLDISKAVVMPTSLFWGGALVGGALFGIGMVLTQSVSAVLLAMYAGPLCAMLSELFPTKVRFTALSIGYSLAVTIFGGFAPFIAAFLIRTTGSPVSRSVLACWPPEDS